jgi:hypothetical protein
MVVGVHDVVAVVCSISGYGSSWGDVRSVEAVVGRPSRCRRCWAVCLVFLAGSFGGLLRSRAEALRQLEVVADSGCWRWTTSCVALAGYADEIPYGAVLAIRLQGVLSYIRKNNLSGLPK